MIILKPIDERIVELTTTNEAPALTMMSHGDGRKYAFGLTNNPRFLFERPYAPDDAWSVAVDLAGGLAQELPSSSRIADAAIEVFLGRSLDYSSRGILHALPAGRYALVRSSRKLVQEARILLGNERVQAPPNALVLGVSQDSYAVAFGANQDLKPNSAGLFVGVAVLAYNGHDTMDGMWLFDLSGGAESTTSSGEVVMVLPLEGPLVIDALVAFRNDGSCEAKQRWAGERGASFVRWCAGS